MNSELLRSVKIKSETKFELDRLVLDYPDIKKLYFIDKAVQEAIALERRIRELRQSSQTKDQ